MRDRIFLRPIILIVLSFFPFLNSQSLAQVSGSGNSQNDPLSWTDPVDEMHDACEFDSMTLFSAQALVDASIAQWVQANTDSFNISGGCTPILTNNFTVQNIDYCSGGSVTIIWTITDQCEEDVTASATYTFTPPPSITFTMPMDETHDACEFVDASLAMAQINLDADLHRWVSTNQHALVAAGGCSPTVTNDFVAQSIDYCAGSSITVTWTIEDLCETIDVTATYTLIPKTPPTFTAPIDIVISCDEDPYDLNITGEGEDIYDECKVGRVKLEYKDFRNTVVNCEGTIYRLWTATDVCRHESEAVQLIYVIPASGISNKESLSRLIVYPNPTTGEFYFKYLGPTQGLLKLSIIDISGREIFYEEIENNQTDVLERISLPKKSHGVYYLRLIEETGVTVRKIVVR